MPRAPTGQRKQQILQSLALQLETAPGERITTARLAASVGVSEAALYRHFSNKAQMFEALIVFAEETVFGLCHKISQEQLPLGQRCQRIVMMVLSFAERNPGICRLLMGEALVGEADELRARVGQFFERLETHVRTLLREADLTNGERAAAPPSRVAALLITLLEGRMRRFVRSEFKQRPTEDMDANWLLLHRALFRE